MSLYYIAGLFDARAKYLLCKTGAKSGKRTRSVISCAGLADPVREFLLSSIGGYDAHGSLESVSRRNCTEHCEEPHVHYGVVRKQEWRLEGYPCLSVLLTLKPMLLNWNEGAQAIVDNETPYISRAKKETKSNLRKLGWYTP